MYLIIFIMFDIYNLLFISIIGVKKI